MFISKNDWSELAKDATLLADTINKIRSLRAHLEHAAEHAWCPLTQDALHGFLDAFPSEKSLCELAGE